MSRKLELIVDYIAEGYTLEQAENLAEQQLRGDM